MADTVSAQRAFDHEAKRWHDLYQDLLQHLGTDVAVQDRHAVAKDHIKSGEAERAKRVNP